MSATNFTLFDVGGCNCSPGTCATLPCALPQSNLSVTYVAAGGGGTASGTLVYSTPGPCWWQACLSIPAIPALELVTIGLSGTCTIFGFSGVSGPGVLSYPGCVGMVPNGNFWDDPTNCSGITTPFARVTLSSYSCSPLNLVFTHSTASWTITL